MTPPHYPPPWTPTAIPSPKPWRWLAVLSIIFGVIGLAGLLSLAGLVCGIVALDRAKAAGDRPTAAWWGVALSTITLLVSVTLFYAYLPGA